jgi:molybdenum cofactor cytidylyltransferase
LKIAILILAAGNSKRMGVTKQLLPLGNTTLLGITIKNVIDANCTAMYCVLGADAVAVKKSISKFNIETIFNPNFKSGLSSSIVVGIQHIIKKQFDAVLILLGDQPFVNATYINEMIVTYKNHPEQIIASTYKTTIGVPAMVPKSDFKELLKLKGDKGAKDFLINSKDRIIQLKGVKLLDIDTKEDYEDFLKFSNFE